MLEARLRVPQSVVFRSFPSETVVLNLRTGKYHGLNPTAGRMLEQVSAADSVQAAAATLATEYERPREEVEADLCDLCRALLERGLIEFDEDDR
jgi:Coenzyme PQQ synthesis protein D (PqqD)